MTKSQFDVSVHRILTRMRHAREDTEFRAHVALMQAMYTKGHPHWVHDYTGALQELRSVTYEEVRDVCRNWSIGTGAIVCLAGDLQVKKSLHMLREVFGALSVGVDENAQVHDCTRIRVDTPMYDVVSMKGKQNVDTVFGIPMAVSVTDSFFPSLRAGVHILGGSSTSRLFNTLRTKKSFTYGAYASLKLFSPSYPGYLGGMAVYPHEVFHTGREALREVVESFVLKGVTQKELREYIEEERGRFSIGLSSTGGIGRALFGTLVEKKPIAYLETYLSTLNELTVRTVNEAIREHVPISQLKIIGAGAVDKDGRPI